MPVLVWPSFLPTFTWLALFSLKALFTREASWGQELCLVHLSISHAERILPPSCLVGPIPSLPPYVLALCTSRYPLPRRIFPVSWRPSWSACLGLSVSLIPGLSISIPASTTPPPPISSEQAGTVSLISHWHPICLTISKKPKAPGCLSTCAFLKGSDWYVHSKAWWGLGGCSLAPFSHLVTMWAKFRTRKASPLT